MSHARKSPPLPPAPALRDKIKILPNMERASKLIRGSRLSGDVITPEQLCCAAWPEAVGKKIAAPYPRRQAGAHPPGRRSGGPHLAAAVVRPHAPHFAQPGSAPGPRPGRRPGIPHRAPPPRARASRARPSPRSVRGRRRRHRRPRDARPLQALAEKGTSVKITEKEVRYVAGLANLTLTDAEDRQTAGRSRRHPRTYGPPQRGRHHGRRTHVAGALRVPAKPPRCGPTCPCLRSATRLPWPTRRNPAPAISRCRKSSNAESMNKIRAWTFPP